MGFIIAWLGRAFITGIGFSAVRFTATKVILWVMMVTIFPAVLMHVFWMFYNTVISTITQVDGAYGLDPNSLILEFSGIAAWFAIHLKLVEGFSLLMSAVLFRIATRMIPFVRL